MSVTPEEMTATLDGGADIVIEDEATDVIENADGSADIVETIEVTEEESGFYDNLCFDIPEDVLEEIATDLLEKIDHDKQAREKRDKQYAEGIRRTGLGDDAPGGGQFQGASKVVHPMLTTSSIEFESRTIKELFPPGGPVKVFIPGTVTKPRWKKAERKKQFFNWQLTQQMKEFRPELEKVLTQTALGGVCYQRFFWSPQFRRPVSHSVTVDKIYLPYAASSFYTAERITYVDDITEFTYEQRVRDGIYRDVGLIPPAMVPDETKSGKARDKVEGRESDPYNTDGLRRTYEINTYLRDIEQHTGLQDDCPPVLPYLVYVDADSKKVLSVVRNWEQEDHTYERMHWIVEWGFVPWEGAYPIGLVHMIGGLSAAATGSLRALLDAAMVNNFPSAARLKGAQVSGQSMQISPTQIVEINGGVGAEDIRKVLMPFPFNPPSETLFRLLGFLVESGQEVVRTAFEKFSDNNPNAPVGTTYAYIEQGLVVVSAIIGRMYGSMNQTLQVIQRIDKMYITDKEIKNEAGEVLCSRQDLQGPMDCIPVSDPSTPSDAHRFAQVQTIMMRADARPDLYDSRKVEQLFLERMRVPNPEDLLKAEQKPQEMNAVNENVAATMGRPITAFPEQDHLAHLQTHIDYMMSPVLGLLPIIAPQMMPIMLGHLKEHISMWYAARVYEHLTAMMGRDFSEYMEIAAKRPDLKAEIDANIATVSSIVCGEDAMAAFQQYPGIIQRAVGILQQFQPQIQDPNAQVQAQRNQIQAKKNDDDASIKRQELAQKAKDMGLRVVESRTKVQADVHKEQQKQQHEDRRLQVAEQGDTIRQEQKITADVAMNQEDNATAMAIAAAEIKSGEKVAVSTGGDSSPGR